MPVTGRLPSSIRPRSGLLERMRGALDRACAETRRRRHHAHPQTVAQAARGGPGGGDATLAIIGPGRFNSRLAACAPPPSGGE